MAEPLSTDLRERVVAAVKGGMSRRRAAAHFRVGISSAIRWVAQAETCGDLRPKPMGGDRRSAAIEAQADTILSLRAKEPDTTLAEFRDALAAPTNHLFLASLAGQPANPVNEGLVCLDLDIGLDARDQLRVRLGGVPGRAGEIPLHAAWACRGVRDAGVVRAVENPDARHHRPLAQRRTPQRNAWLGRLVFALSP